MARRITLAATGPKTERTGLWRTANWFDLCNAIFLIGVCCITIYPFWYVLVYSLNTGSDAMAGPIWFWPRDFTLENYRYALDNPYITNAFGVTLARVFCFSIFSVAVNMFAAYALANRKLPGRRLILFVFLIPMFVGGTVVSNYVVMAKLGLLNHFLVYVLPGAFSFFNMIIMRTFIEQIPVEVEESAKLDGAGYFRLFYSIILPLSKPVLAAMGFFAVVFVWLDFQTNLLFITDKDLYVLQYVLYMVTLSNQSQNLMQTVMSQGVAANMSTGEVPTPEVLKMAILVIVTAPLLFVYPFFQKYFVKGMMVGAIKA